MVVWAEEITLEMLWAHATAPGAKILPVLAPKLATNDLYNTTNYVVNHNLADVISQSLGAAETCMDPTILASQHGPGARRATRTGVTDQAGSSYVPTGVLPIAAFLTLQCPARGHCV